MPLETRGLEHAIKSLRFCRLLHGLGSRHADGLHARRDALATNSKKERALPVFSLDNARTWARERGVASGEKEGVVIGREGWHR